MDLHELIELQNPHREEGFFYPKGVEREVFPRILSFLDYPHIVALSGVRRVGKTTILRQLMNHLIAMGVPRRNIFYFSYDEKVVEPLQLLKAWKEIHGFMPKGRHFYFFLDEVQRLSNWGEKLKTIYDSLGIKMLISGSASLHLRKGRESLAGRMFEIEVPPLSFTEYMHFSSSASSWENYKAYMRRQLPELALYPINAKEYVRMLVKKVIYEDMLKYFSIEDAEVVEGIFSIIERQPGQIIKIEDIAKEFSISRPTASKYLRALEDALLVRKLYNYSTNPRKVEIRAKKYYPSFTTLCAYHDATPFSLMAETEVMWKLDIDYFWNDRGKEVDGVVVRDGQLVAVEVKMGKRIDRRDVKYLLSFPYPAKKLIIVAPDAEVAVEGVDVVPLPEVEKLQI